MPLAVKSAAESARVSVASAEESTDGTGARTATESQRRETREGASRLDGSRFPSRPSR
jgi:hypothetical protein